MEHETSNHGLRVIVAGLSILLLPVFSRAELAPDSYCQLTVQIQSKELDYLGKVDILTQKDCEDKDCFKWFCSDTGYYLSQRVAMQKELADAKAAAFTAAGTTAKDYAAFQDTIAGYLEANPEVKASLDTLASQINQLKDKLRMPCYCLLTIAHAKQNLANTSEHIDLVRQYSNDPQALKEQEQAKRKEWDAKIEALFAAFDTTGQEYLLFMAKNGPALKPYLDKHPAIKKAIDDLSGQVVALLRQCEELRDSIVKAPGAGLPK